MRNLIDWMFFIFLEFEVKRGSGIKTITPVPRRRSDPEFLKWENDVNSMLDDDYEGTLFEIIFFPPKIMNLFLFLYLLRIRIRCK